MLERLSISFKDKNNTFANDAEEYKKFFDIEFQKYYHRLSEEFPIDIDVRTEINRRFKDFEVRLESNEDKVINNFFDETFEDFWYKYYKICYF